MAEIRAAGPGIPLEEVDDPCLLFEPPDYGEPAVPALKAVRKPAAKAGLRAKSRSSVRSRHGPACCKPGVVRRSLGEWIADDRDHAGRARGTEVAKVGPRWRAKILQS